MLKPDEFVKEVEEEIKFIDNFSSCLWLAKHLRQALSIITALQGRVEKLEGVVQRILNEDFSGQSKLSAYIKREAQSALEE